MNFVSCTKWIKKGVAKATPEKVQLTSQELRDVCTANTGDIIEEDDEEIDEPEDDKDQYNFETYDANDTDNIKSTFGIESLVTLDPGIGENEIDSEEEDDLIKPDDNLIVVGHIEEDASVLEVYVYNENTQDMYVHHDILLPYVPLCLEWFNFDPSHPTAGNLIAVGGMTPEITVWDLDIVNCLEPAFKLGKCSKKSGKNPGKKIIGHKDAVLDISWNENAPHILGSASVDKSVIVWDLEVGKVALHFKEFNDKVQCLKWHHLETETFLSGCCDKYVRMFDCRQEPITTLWNVNGEVESLSWNPSSHSNSSWEAFVGTDNGTVHCIETRMNRFKWQIPAHNKEITSLAVHPKNVNTMVTCSTDGLVKMWDISKNNPTLISAKCLNAGELHCLDLNPDYPHIGCVGGSKKSKVFSIIDLLKISLDQEKNHLPTQGKSSSETKTTSGLKNMSLDKSKFPKKNKTFPFKKKRPNIKN